MLFALKYFPVSYFRTRHNAMLSQKHHCNERPLSLILSKLIRKHKGLTMKLKLIRKTTIQHKLFSNKFKILILILNFNKI